VSHLDRAVSGPAAQVGHGHPLLVQVEHPVVVEGPRAFQVGLEIGLMKISFETLHEAYLLRERDREV